jgi:tRNA(Ile)-lysidine synthase
MPACALRTGIAWHRPLLQVPGADLRQWLMDQGQAWVEDPSNQDERYTRNRIRRVLLPALQACFPQFRATLARSAAHAAQAAQLLVELAQQDLCDVGNPPVIGRLQALSPPRQANVLRFWLVSVYQTTATAAQLRALQQQLAACTTRGHRIHLKIGRGFSVREGDCLVWRTHA